MRMTRAARQMWLARVTIGTLSLAGVVYAAEQTPAPEGASDLTQTIKTQKVSAGELAPTNMPDEHQATPFTPDQMLVLAARYEQEMKIAVERSENARIIAYRTRDIIRMTCIDDKLTQMRTVLNIIAPRLVSIRNQTEELAIRQQFSLIHQAQARIAELVKELDACTGDDLKTVSGSGRIQEEVPANDSAYDPTRPPSPGVNIDRPAEASPYR